MKVWILAGLFTAAMAPLASAQQITTECEFDEPRRASQTRLETPQPVATPAVRPPAPRVTAEQTPRPDVPRRRGGKRIPDAELIGPRGAL